MIRVKLGRVQWLDWSKESFEKARAEGKPILLDIKGSWCHWCHVMDETSYSDPAIVDALNKKFVSIRVDTDKRPDVNRRYNMGGWPTTAFLDSDGKIITGGTYIPPEQLREVIRSVLDMYAKNKGKIRSKLEPPRVPKATTEPLTESIAKDIATSIAVNFDIDYGGFGFEPKFPQTDSLEYALLRYRYHGEREMLTVVNRTLEKMGKGGLYDHVGDGFFRYSTTRDWTIPHFEKMAEDNARLLATYLKAYQVTGNPFFKERTEGILRYVQSKLADLKDGGFYGSQDADEEYYKLGLDERQKCKAPSIDRTFYTNYNVLFVSSYFLAGAVLNNPEYTKFALKTLERVVGTRDSEGALPHHFGVDVSALKGLLVDHALTLHALVDAYEHTGNWEHIETAKKLLDYSIRTLGDETGGGFYDIPEQSAAIGELRARDKPMDENSAMATAMLRLSWITGYDTYERLAEKTLRLFASEYEKFGIMAAPYALALEFLLNGPVGITILGSKSKETEKFRLQARKLYPVRRYLLQLDPAQDSERIKQLGYDATAAPVAYVCVGKVCGPPLKDPSRIEPTVSSLLYPAPMKAAPQ
jgi:uncharacterized protein YyaL (SSP411 family)